jgi:hypothetical protein
MDRLQPRSQFAFTSLGVFVYDLAGWFYSAAKSQGSANMTGLALLLAASAMGVDYGWRPHEEGGVEYIIQVEPEVFASLQAGGDIVSEIHPDAGDVRRFRIRLGRGPLPREEANSAADDGPLPPAPPGDLTSSNDSTPGATSTARGRSASPPLNHLAQGSGYGNPFGGYSSGGYTRGTSGGTAMSTSGTTGTTPSDRSGAGTTGTTSGSYGGGRTASDYTGSSRNGYTEYTGASTSGAANPAGASAANNGGTSGTTASGTTASGDSWNRGELRTASNQQTVTASSSSANTGATATAPAGANQYTQPAAGQTTASHQPASSNATSGGATPSNQAQTGQTQTGAQPAYSTTTAGSYRGTRDYSATSGTTDASGYPQPQSGTVTPVSGYDSSRTATQQTATQGADQSRWTAASAARQDQQVAPPPAYPQGSAGEQPGYLTTGANGGYANPGYSNAYSNQNQYPQGAAPPLLAPPAAAPGNYGYAPAGYPPYQAATQQAAGYGYGQAPGYYAMPSLTPPVLTASAADTSSSSRSRRDEDEEEEDYRERRSSAVLPAAVPAAPVQANVVNSEPWLAFTITIVLLFASIGGNIYLLWISQDFYWRYKELANDLRNFNSAAS